jgi:ubiquitin
METGSCRRRWLRMSFVMGAGLVAGVGDCFAESCAVCRGSGNGSLPCGSCNGTGKRGAFKCTACDGRRFMPCSRCSGSGQVDGKTGRAGGNTDGSSTGRGGRSPSASGQARETSSIPCGLCGGTGKRGAFKCSACNGLGFPLRAGVGAGSGACASCKGTGTGSLACSLCKGTGMRGAFKCFACDGRKFSRCGVCNGSGRAGK